MICPTCGKLISVNEERCPFCGAWRPGMFGYAPALQKVIGRVDLSRLVIIACVVMYVVSLALQPEAMLGGGGLMSFLSPGSRALYQLGMTGGVAWQQHWWWTLFTATYLHGGLLHIAFNMLSLYRLMPTVSDWYGAARAFVIYTIGGAVGYLVSNIHTGHPTIGASSSIFALVGAIVVHGRRRGGGAMAIQLYQWAFMLFLMSFFIPSVNNWAHGGGFAGGFIVAEAMRFGDERRESRAVQLLAVACVLVTIAGFVLSFVKVTAILMQR